MHLAVVTFSRAQTNHAVITPLRIESLCTEGVRLVAEPCRAEVLGQPTLLVMPTCLAVTLLLRWVGRIHTPTPSCPVTWPPRSGLISNSAASVRPCPQPSPACLQPPPRDSCHSTPTCAIVFASTEERQSARQSARGNTPFLLTYPTSWTAHPRAGRAGWVGTRNFEVDSGAYYLSLLFNFYSAVGHTRAADTLMRPEVTWRCQS